MLTYRQSPHRNVCVELAINRSGLCYIKKSNGFEFDFFFKLPNFKHKKIKRIFTSRG